MTAWPPIAEPLLRERLAMDDEAFVAFMRELLGGLPPRPFGPEVLATALGYPWERPARSYLLDGERVALLDEMDEAERRAAVAARARGEDGTPRYGLLAFGSNGAPATLARKFAHLPALERRVLVLAGELRGYDVGAAAMPTAYGSMAATLFESPGTAVRAAVLWVSAVQLTQLSWTEISYRLGRLGGAAFHADQEDATDPAVLVYASRWGTFCPGGAPLAQAAIPATGRTAEACTQEELLARAADLMLGDGAGAEALVRAIFEDMPALVARGHAVITATGRPFAPAAFERWTPPAA